VYELVHRTSYVYDEEVTASFGRAHLIPRHGDGQHRLDGRVVVEPAPSDLREHTDFFGNRSVYFEVKTPHTELTVTGRSLVAVHREPPAPDALEIGWTRVRDHVTNGPGAELLDVRPFLLPSPLVAPSPTVTDYTADILRTGRSIGDVLTQLVARIHDEFEYTPGATTVSTTLSELLERRAGVCQDFAHLAVAVLRCAGLPARYVSGYLETRPPPGRPRLAGADASHAWASVFVPDLGWVDLDPTNRALADERYVVAAIGRDYSDVPPLRGVIFTDATTSTMRVAVDMIAVGPAGEPGAPPVSPSLDSAPRNAVAAAETAPAG
jgi:transglutaminase-like putative cysteine protease